MNQIAAVERSPEKAGVGGSIPSLATIFTAYRRTSHPFLSTFRSACITRASDMRSQKIQPASPTRAVRQSVRSEGKNSAGRESLRQRYRPDRVRMLFVGEAPPASGKFFYQQDSGLYRAVRDTFLIAFPLLPKKEFLDYFRSLGCYLVDLCGGPVDKMPDGPRRSACCAGEVHLARMIRELHPKVIVTFVRSIRSNVTRAQSQARWRGLHLELPYPGQWHRHRIEFRRRLVPLLRKTLGDPISAPFPPSN